MRQGHELSSKIPCLDFCQELCVYEAGTRALIKDTMLLTVLLFFVAVFSPKLWTSVKSCACMRQGHEDHHASNCTSFLCSCESKAMDFCQELCVYEAGTRALIKDTMLLTVLLFFVALFRPKLWTSVKSCACMRQGHKL